MTARYEIYLCDDAGRRINLLEDIAFFNYARTVFGYSNCTIGLNFDTFVKEIPSVFSPDWRVDIWRSPIEGVPARREKSFFLRKYIVYQRIDGVRILELFGRDARDVLRRNYISSFTSGGRTDYIDDMMKYIVSNYLVGTSVVPTGELIVEGDSGDGPIVSYDPVKKNVLDSLNELHEMSETLHLVSSANDVIYFDMVEDSSLVTNGFGYRFRTYAGLCGMDRTAGLLFSTENGNINDPNYFEDYLDAFTVYDVFNQDSPSADASASVDDQYLSRWNYARTATANSSTSALVNQNVAYTELQKLKRRKFMNVQFVNSPGGPDQPRSLYGLDWDLGDLLQVKFGGKTFNAEVKVVYVSVNDKGQEKVTGRSSIGE